MSSIAARLQEPLDAFVDLASANDCCWGCVIGTTVVEVMHKVDWKAGSIFLRRESGRVNQTVPCTKFLAGNLDSHVKVT